ncbi:MAG: hypothetical protein BM556_00945 [Bacteriovorax sp. MedPE-SWde]|mgnify:CR=1 FL=1|nr:MAG: hypothetical protein BM556_00945 [Bacteriovorax sp. MedPE-SWde]
MKATLLLIHFLGISLLASSCAGPMNPFGSDTANIFDRANEAPLWKSKRVPAEFSNVDISFFPKRQNWHSSHDFYIILQSKTEKLTINNVKLYWNHKDISKSLFSAKEIVFENEESLIIKVKSLRLMANSENDINAYYVSALNKKVYGQEYKRPRCEFREEMKVTHTTPFKVKPSFIKLVSNESKNHKINPSLMTALIAQESGFNPNSVSYAKAIGLTQVTNLASHHVLKKFRSWKSDRRIKKLPAPLVRAMIKLGKINRNHDWRLDKRKSVKGGIAYLEYLDRYWRGNIELIERVYGTNYDREQIYTDLILASYNSGPYRIKMRLIREGRKWYKSNLIKEARKYMGKIKSYCYHFNQKKGGGYEKQASNF